MCLHICLKCSHKYHTKNCKIALNSIPGIISFKTYEWEKSSLTCNSAKLKKYKYLFNRNVILQFEFENSILHLLSLYINCRCAISKYIEISIQIVIKNKIPSYGWIAWRTEACLLFSYMYNSVHLYKRPINFGDLIGVTQWLLLVFGYTWVLSSFRLRIKPVPSVVFTILPQDLE